MLNRYLMLKIDESLLEQLFDNIDEVVIILNPKNEIFYANKAAKQLFNSQFTKGQNIFSQINELQTINFFNNVLSTNTDETFKYFDKFLTLKKNVINNFTFLYIKDNTYKIRYKSFKTELIGNIAHELKTPLALIQNYVETLLYTDNLSEDERSNFLGIIYTSTIRINNLISDIIYLHKLENLNANFAVEDAVNLKDIEKELKTAHANKDKKIIFDIPETSVFIKPTHIISTLNNLIDNADKYSTGDNIYVKVEHNDRIVRIKVDDEGPIIPEEERKRIFERFYTRSKSRNKQKTGTGLGLSIVKHISSLYNGFVDVYPNEFKGNRFEVLLYEKKRN